MATEKKWQPETKEMVRTLIRTAVKASGGTKPEDLPHLVRSRLEGQVSGDIDVDDYIKSVLEEMKKKGEI